MVKIKLLKTLPFLIMLTGCHSSDYSISNSEVLSFAQGVATSSWEYYCNHGVVANSLEELIDQKYWSYEKGPVKYTRIKPYIKYKALQNNYCFIVLSGRNIHELDSRSSSTLISEAKGLGEYYILVKFTTETLKVEQRGKSLKKVWK